MKTFELKPTLDRTRSKKYQFTLTPGLTVTKDPKLGLVLVLGSKDFNVNNYGYFEKIAVDDQNPPPMKSKQWTQYPAWLIEDCVLKTYQLSTGTVCSKLIHSNCSPFTSSDEFALVRINTHLKGNAVELTQEAIIELKTPSLAIGVSKRAYHRYGLTKAPDCLYMVKHGALMTLVSDHKEVPMTNARFSIINGEVSVTLSEFTKPELVAL